MPGDQNLITNAGLAAARQVVDYLKNGVTKFQVNK